MLDSVLSLAIDWKTRGAWNMAPSMVEHDATKRPAMKKAPTKETWKKTKKNCHELNK